MLRTFQGLLFSCDYSLTASPHLEGSADLQLPPSPLPLLAQPPPTARSGPLSSLLLLH